MAKDGHRISVQNRLRPVGGVLGLAFALVLAVVLASPNVAFAAARPLINHVSPDSGWTSGGNTVRITGKNFAIGGKSIVKKVTFGAGTATHISVKSATTITVTAPAGKGTVNVHVTTKAGTSVKVSADKYTYKTMPPTITGLYPASGSTLGGTMAIIAGTGFTGTDAVMFGANAATSFTVMSDSLIIATAPASAAGAIEVTVTTPGARAPHRPLISTPTLFLPPSRPSARKTARPLAAPA